MSSINYFQEHEVAKAISDSINPTRTKRALEKAISRVNEILHKNNPTHDKNDPSYNNLIVHLTEVHI